MVLDLAQDLCVAFNTLFNLAAIHSPSSFFLHKLYALATYSLNKAFHFKPSHTYVSISHLLNASPISSKYVILPLRPSFNVCFHGLLFSPCLFVMLLPG